MKHFLYIISIILVCGLAFTALFMPTHDNTDPPGGHSGMVLLTDNFTGCQYLYRSGAIIQRMDKNGKQICTNQ